MKKLIKTSAAIIAACFIILSCDNEVNSLGSDFLNIDVDNTIQEQEFEVKSFNALLNQVQVNDLPINKIGFYNDPVYGQSKYSIVSQIALGFVNPDFGVDPVLKNVEIVIPYFSTATGVDGEETLYELDSVYNSDPFRLELFENEFFLNNFDPNNLSDNASYKNDLIPSIENNRGPLLFSGTFVPDANEDIVTGENETIVSRNSPRFRRTLAFFNENSMTQSDDYNYWNDKIFSAAAAPNLVSQSAFQNYFRGIYFRVSNAIGESNLTAFNLNEAEIILTADTQLIDVNDLDNDGDTTDLFEVESSFRINFRGQTINFIENNIPGSVVSEIDVNSDMNTGSEKIFLKGGGGTIGFIDLFGEDLDADGEADQLTDLKNRNVLINDAILELFIETNDVDGGDVEPERIFLYDFDNNSVLADFNSAALTGDGLNSNLTHLGRLERDSNGDGVKYTLRISRYLNRLIALDEPLVRLGLVTSQNVNVITSQDVNMQSTPFDIEEVPTGSVISHEGTVLHGSESTDPSKRLKFTVFFSETE